MISVQTLTVIAVMYWVWQLGVKTAMYQLEHLQSGFDFIALIRVYVSFDAILLIKVAPEISNVATLFKKHNIQAIKVILKRKQR